MIVIWGKIEVMRRFFVLLFFITLVSFFTPKISFAQSGQFYCNNGTCQQYNGACAGAGCPTFFGTSEACQQTCNPNGGVKVGTNLNFGILCNGTTDQINTAIGCVPFTDQNALVGFILRWALGIGGGIAFLLILVAGFQIMTSRGDPKRLQGGQELMTSAIAGLLLLIFSLFILRLIGIDILNIPGFNKP